MNDNLLKAIGGYFELEISYQEKRLYSNSLRFQSARAAFYSLLVEGKPSRVWMPAYICNSMLAPLDATNTEIVFYNINLDFEVISDIQIKDGDWILYVNYFGVCSSQEDSLLKRFKPFQIIFDHSQAYFSPPKDCLATIYSPRKFFGVPDGGFMFTSLPVAEPERIDTDSVSRCTHLLKRLNAIPEEGYQDFKSSEETFNDVQPRRLSQLTDCLLKSIDYDACKKQRNANFHFLHSQLKHMNDLNFDISRIDGPMCYPMLIDDDTIRDRLLAKRIFVPKYWGEVEGRVKYGSVESKLLNKLLPLPCDQRYRLEDMMRIVECLQGNKA